MLSYAHILSHTAGQSVKPYRLSSLGDTRLVRTQGSTRGAGIVGLVVAEDHLTKNDGVLWPLSHDGSGWCWYEWNMMILME